MSNVRRQDRTGSLLVGATLMAMGIAITTAHAAEPPDYLGEVKPLLAEKCFACHGALKQEAALRLDAISLIRRGGDSGAAIAPGNVAESLLIERIGSPESDLRMPPPDAGHPLTEQQITLLKAWIAAGAAAPEEAIPADPGDHWSFQPPREPAVPPRDAAWVRSEIDCFLAAEHQRMGLAAVGEGSPSLLLRRVYLDLIGLPPTPDQLQTFLNDASPEAWENTVDQLLDSPRYGERWARHFMDIWRYSDPSGYGDEIRDGRKHIWRWRDWIIDSLNADKPYDQMVVEMLAADEIAPDDLDAARATGFLARNWYKFNRNVWLDNTVEHTSKAFLGLTVNCARCHDHKYDPLGHHEYYQLRAFFEPHDVRDDPLAAEVLVRAFDARADTPTYPFTQGDENRPDTEHPLAPGVPAVLGGNLRIEPIELPATAYYPSLRLENREASLAAATAEVQAAKSALASAEQAVEVAAAALAKSAAEAPLPSTAAAETPDAPPPASPKTAGDVVWKDDFATLDLRHWTVEGGRWESRAGRLHQAVGETIQHRLVSKIAHPRDFRARVTIRITGGAMWRSVGLGFDGHGKAMHAVYLSAVAGGSKAQVTVQDNTGRWAYPATGAVAREIRLDQDYELEIVVRDRLMNVLIDDTLQLAFTLPERPAPGALSIFTFSAQAEFDDLSLTTLPPETSMVADTNGPAAAQSSGTAETALRQAEAAANVASSKLALQEAKLDSLTARMAAELVKYALCEGDAPQLDQAAARAARWETIRRHQHQIAVETQTLANVAGGSAADAKGQQAAAQARKNLALQEKQLAAAQQQLESGSPEYPALGPIHPATSTGRRRALAQWIVHRENPLAARVLVNHVWLRHFDAPLVERMFDFGLRSARPQHADLLDWLAVRFMEDGWSIKALHRRIVLSGAYRLRSAPPMSPPTAVASAAANRQIDPDNLALWRMNPRRMEAEVARDSLLMLGGSLDVTMGGPPISHTQGQNVLRRSLYFRQDKERQMTFLSLFDGAKVNECYRRKATVAPQQALAMFNSQLAWEQAGKLATGKTDADHTTFITDLFRHVLCRVATAEELEACEAFLAGAEDRSEARRQLALVLLNHNDFVTVR